jgi:RHS repeat-associated protein
VRSLTKASDGSFVTFSYDINGNLTSGDGKTLTYNAFNKPLSIHKGITSTFRYGANQQRYKQVTTGAPGGLKTTIYIDKVYENITQNGMTQQKLYLEDAIITDAEGGNTLHFLHRDRLGSVVTVTNQDGYVVDNKSFDPFGKPRKGTLELVDPATVASLKEVAFADMYDLVTQRGFTDHEHLDDAQLIHMNGRVYDYNLGRFLSVDPFIQKPSNSQSTNPYSYLMNNPLSGTDPTGYFKEPGETGFYAGLVIGVAWGTTSVESAQEIADVESSVGNHSLQGAGETGEVLRGAVTAGSVAAAAAFLSKKAEDGFVRKGKKRKNQSNGASVQQGSKTKNESDSSKIGGQEVVSQSKMRSSDGPSEASDKPSSGDGESVAAKGRLQGMADEIRSAGNHPAAKNHRVIAVGEDVNGNLFAGSSNGFDAGQRATANELGAKRVPSSKGLHAEENLMRNVNGLKKLGTSKRSPCGASEHNCAAQLSERGIEVDNQ